MPRSKKKYNERIEIGRGPDGKRIRKWIRADTKPELEAQRRAAYQNTESARNPSAISFGDYKDKWFQAFKSNVSPGTQENYLNSFKKLGSIDKKKLSSITAMDLQTIINDNWDHPRACESIKSVVRQICKSAIRDGILTGVNPAEDLLLPKPAKKETRFITDDEMKIIEKIEFSPFEKLYLAVLRYTGMRPSEGLALMYEDIDFDNRNIHVSRSIGYSRAETHLKGTKTGVERDIPLHNSLAFALKSEGKKEGFIFLQDGKPLTKNDYLTMFKRITRRIAKELGHSEIVLYSFRHTFATFLYYSGCRPGLISTKKAAQIMGHSERIFLETYTHIDDSQENVLDIIDRL